MDPPMDPSAHGFIHGSYDTRCYFVQFVQFVHVSNTDRWTTLSATLFNCVPATLPNRINAEHAPESGVQLTVVWLI